MGGGGFGRAYASGSNTKINQAALAKAAARAPKTVGSVISKQQKELVDLYSNPFASTIGSPSIGLPEPVKAASVAPANNSRVLEIMKMANGSITPDMLNDFNKDGRVTSADALLYQKNQVTDTSNSFVAPAVQPVKEEVVSLASPFDFNATPFASTVTSPIISEPEPVKVMGSRTEPTTPAFKAGDREWIYDDAGDKIGFTTYKEQKRYDSSGKVTGSKVVPRTTYYSPTTVQDTRQRKESYGTTNIADIAAQLEAEAPSKARTGMDLFSEFDPGRGDMMGYNVNEYNRVVNVDRPLLNAFKDLDYKPYKEFDVPELDTGGLDYDKTKLYLNYGERGQLDFPSQEAEKEYNEKRRTGTFHDVSELLGLNPELGQHTMVWVKNPPEPSKWEKFLGNPVLQVVGLLNPTVALATTGAKLASGVDVSPVELATSLMTGLEMTGAVQAPVNAGKFDSTKLAGPVAPTGSTAGTGLFGTSYNQTKTALNVAAAGDAKGAAIALVGDNIIKGGLEKVGIDEKAITDAGIQYDDFEAGVNKTVQKLAEGEELDEALAFGVGKYIGEGGTLGSIDLPSINLPSINLGDSEILEPIADALSAAETAVRQGLSKFDKEVLQPVTKPIGDTLSAAETEVRQGLSTLDKEVLQPITQPIGDIAEDVAQVTGDVVEDVAQATGDVVEDVAQVTGDVVEDVARPVGDVIEDVAQVTGDVIEDVAQGAGDVLSDLDTAIRQALPDIDLPDVDLPDVDLPSVDLPFDLLTSLMSDTGQDFIPSPTRTTDSLFNDELFKFETEIGISDYPLVDEELELFYPESALQLDYGRDADNFFENTIYEAKPRSYDF